MKNRWIAFLLSAALLCLGACAKTQGKENGKMNSDLVGRYVCEQGASAAISR